MSDAASFATLHRRAAIAVSGPDWRDFLQGLITQDVLTLTNGEIRFGALLTPQGRLICDLFIVGRGEDALVDCPAEARVALIDRLRLYRLRAKVEIEPVDLVVQALWGADAAPAGFSPDPRTPDLGWRGYGAPRPQAISASETDYDAHRLACGAPGEADWRGEGTYPIEANFDLLGGIDFRKGCFVGQETTSRMKRRGQIKTRMAPIAWAGPAPEAGAELLAGTLRAGEVLSVQGDRAMALIRLDRVEAGDLTFAEGGSWRPLWPDWLASERPA